MRPRLLALLSAAGFGLLTVAPAGAADPEALCGGRAGCLVHAVTPAGIGATGPVSVVEIRLPEPPAGSDYEGQSCADDWREIYIAEGETTTLLLQLCNDGYGAAGMGEDSIEIGENWLSHQQFGGSNWRWSQTLLYQLSPLRVLREESNSFWTIGLVYDRVQWDWRDWSQGAQEWWTPECAADGSIPLLDEDPAEEEITRSVLIPLLAEGAAPDAPDAAPGTCATVLSAETGNGYVIHGDVQAAVDDHAWVKVLAVEPDRLHVSVRTGRVASGGRSWLADDHIEIWQGPDYGYTTDCVPRDAPLRQWAVRLVDGAVFAAHGNPERLPELLARSSTLDSDGGVIVSMTLRLADPLENITVLFSKGDGQKKQLWMLASSALRFGKAASLGGFYHVPANWGSCRLSEGRLDVVEWGRPLEEPR